jgi:hypothetical protein
MTDFMLEFRDDYPEDEWIDRGFVPVTVVVGQFKYFLNFYLPMTLRDEIQSALDEGRAWTEGNLVVVGDLQRSAILAYCAGFVSGGLLGLYPTQEFPV